KRAKSGPIVKGGDGGTYPTHGAVGGRSPHAEARANARVYLTCQDPSASRPVDLMETSDPADQAHAVRDHSGMFIPASNRRTVQHARPRKYPRASMTTRTIRRADGRRETRWIGWDSAWDELYEMQARLAGVPGLGRAGNSSAAAAMLDEVLRTRRAD